MGTGEDNSGELSIDSLYCAYNVHRNSKWPLSKYCTFFLDYKKAMVWVHGRVMKPGAYSSVLCSDLR